MKIPKEGSWTFDNEGIANSFDDHVREQLPWYDLVTESVEHIARHYIPENGTVYDIGASTGNIGRAISEILNERSAKLIAVEKEKEMAAKYAGPGELIVQDALDMSFDPFDFGIIFLGAIFMAPHRRGEFFNRFRKSLRPGGAFVMVERMEAGSGYASTIAARLTLSNKLKSGATPDNIILKELSLSGVQRPITERELPQGAVEFFRLGDFAGWLIEKQKEDVQ
jgi:tRNA (cmo5U34)-methyltransferase